jgi:hypothetical protein
MESCSKRQKLGHEEKQGNDNKIMVVNTEVLQLAAVFLTDDSNS